jgi:sugar fermentation stimulation protein A
MRLAEDLDPGYAAAFRAARAAGVEAIAHGARITRQGVWIGPPLPFADPGRGAAGLASAAAIA